MSAHAPTPAPPRSPDPERGPEPWLATALRLVAYAAAGALFAWPFSMWEGVLGALGGALAGSLVGRLVAPSRVRLRVVVVVTLASLLAAGWLHAAATSAPWLAALVGPGNALRAGEMAVWSGGAFGVSLLVRVLAARRRSFAFLEGAVVAAALAELLLAHRHGAIHRPFELADPILTRGGDPSLAVLGVGALGALLIALLWFSERSLLRSALHAAAALLLLLLAFLTTSRVGMPAPPIGGGDGLRLRDGEGEGGGGGGEGRDRDEGPEFQDEYDSSGGQAPVAVVILHDDYEPPTSSYYFRQDAFSAYNGRRLVGASLAGVDDDVAPGFPTVVAVNIAHPPPTGSYRSTVETTVGLLADHPRPFGLESPLQLVPLTNPDRGRFRRTYRVRSAVLTADPWALLGRRAGDPAWSDEVRAHYTRGPDDPRYGELARRIVGDLSPSMQGDPYAQAVAVSDYLGTNGTYSLRSAHASASDPTADFLFGDLTGYCVHFAHAEVFLLRALGLPSRVATGYMVEESARRGGSAILVSGQNSHAWPEVYLDGVGWVVVDVAPASALDPAPPPPDEDLQQLLAELLRGEVPLPPDGSDAPRPISEVLASLRGPLELAALALVLLALALGYGVKLWRRVSPRLVRDPRARPRLVYRATADRMAEAGVRRAPGESRERFARRLGWPGLVPLTGAHEAAAFGGHVSDAAATALDGWADASLAALRQATPRWRRVLGALHPYAWLLTR